MSSEIKPTVFVRRASGLVREVGPWTLAAATFAWTLGAGIHRMMTESNYFYPGGDVALGFTIAGAMIILTALLYTWLMLAMPRTGGDYIFISRVIHPAIAFIVSWGFYIANSFGMGMIAYWAIQSWGTAFQISGSILNNASWISLGTTLQTNFMILGIISMLLVLFFGFITYLGIKAFGVIVRVAVVICLIGSALMFYSYLTHMSTASVLAAWNTYFGAGTTDKIMSLAVSKGFNANNYFPNTFSMNATMGTVLTAMFGFYWGGTSAYMGSEVKTPEKAAWIAIFGVVVFIAVYAIALSFLVTRSYGIFLNAYVFDYYNAKTGLAAILGRQPFIANAGSLASVYYPGNSIMAMLLPFIVAWYITKDLPGFALFASRNVFAFSFDRFFPARFAAVNERFHSPHNAIFLSTVLALIGIVGAMAYDLGVPGASFYFGGDFGTLWWFPGMWGCLAAALLPFMRKDLYERAIKLEIRGFPVVSILGAIGFPLHMWIWVGAAGALGSTLLAATAMWYGIGFAIFIAYWTINVKKGIDPKTIYAEIPPS